MTTRYKVQRRYLKTSEGVFLPGDVFTADELEIEDDRRLSRLIDNLLGRGQIVELPDGPYHIGKGWWIMPDGSRQRIRKEDEDGIQQENPEEIGDAQRSDAQPNWGVDHSKLNRDSYRV